MPDNIMPDDILPDDIMSNGILPEDIMPSHSADPLRPHSHDPNPAPPNADPTMRFLSPTGGSSLVTVADLHELPLVLLADCYIVSTGHGTSGPFTFGGPTLLSLIQHQLGHGAGWAQVEVVSADGFGTRLSADELMDAGARPVLLAWQLDGAPLTRQQGLVRLIVPSERDDALRQVKWIEEIRVRV